MKSILKQTYQPNLYLQNKKKKENFTEKLFKKVIRNNVLKIAGYKNNISYLHSNHTINLEKYTDENFMKQIKYLKEN
jgi:hypothetical protein